MTLSLKAKPNKSNTNLRARFQFAFMQAYKSFDRPTIELILNNPDMLGHNSFFDAIEDCPSNLRGQVAECIVKLVETSDALTEVTNTLSSVFSSDVNACSAMQTAQQGGEKITG